MPSSLLKRLRDALAHQYDVERELGAGGMGAVFLARDVTLERHVAIKVLRPEHATAAAAERFLREARILARLNHPNVVPVHSAGEADGLYYYVMDHIEGETLAERLKRGPLSKEDVVKLGDGLLAALEAVHDSGVIHRDIKPSNVFLVGQRVLLGDFGIAKAVGEESPPLTASGQRVGTPAYMPPEQISGEVSPRTDLYSVGMLLYEAETGERWSIMTSIADVDWSGVAPRTARALRRALEWLPADRFESVAEFREALIGVDAPKAKATLPKLAVAVAAAVILAVVLYRGLGPTRPPATSVGAVSDIAVLPVQVLGGEQLGIDGEDLAILIARYLQRMDVTVVSESRTFPWWDSAYSAGLSAAPEEDAAAGLGAGYAAFATLGSAEGSLRAELDVFDRRGEPRPGMREIRIDGNDPVEVADSVTLRLAELVLGDELPAEIPRLTRDRQALTQFVLGEKAFERGQWDLAVEYYQAAVERDSTFILAWWHMANAWRWLGESGPYPEDYQRLFDAHSDELTPVDSILMAAQLAPAGPIRVQKYREAHRAYPQNGFAAFLCGEELFNRGPLWGQPLDSAVAALGTALALNPSWASAILFQFWASVRLGDRDGALRARDRLLAIAEVVDEGQLLDPRLIALAYSARFDPTAAAEGMSQTLSDVSPGTLAQRSRLGNAFDLPHVQQALGQLLVESTPQLPSFRAGGHIALGLALMTLGSERAALAHFDSVAALNGSDEALVQSAQWRVLIPALTELQPDDPARISRGREVLIGFADAESLGARAAWSLALDAYLNGNAAQGREWAARMNRSPQDDSVVQLQTFLAAVDSAAHGRHEEALRISEPLLAVQACTLPLHGGADLRSSLCQPFVRAALHLLRGKWFARLARRDQADRSWLWYEALDIDGLPSVELPQAGEIDWAFSAYARYLRGTAALEAGDLESACRSLDRVAAFWSEADPQYSELAREAVEGSERSCRGAL